MVWQGRLHNHVRAVYRIEGDSSESKQRRWCRRYAEYACRYATGELKSAPNPANSNGEHVIVAAFAAPGMIYPVSRRPDYAKPAMTHNQRPNNRASKFRGTPLVNQFQSHYACVSATVC